MDLIFIAYLMSILIPELLNDESHESYFVHFRRFLFLSRPFLLSFIYLLSLEESYLLDDESDNYGSESRYSGTCDFPLSLTKKLVVLVA